MKLCVSLTPALFALFICAARAEENTPPVEKPAAGAKENTAPAEPPAAKTAGEAPKTDGTWKPVAGTIGGVAMPEKLLKALSVTFAGNEYEVSRAGDLQGPGREKGTCTIDTSAIPYRITIKPGDGPNKGKSIFAICEATDKDSMRLCYDLSGKEFPKTFEPPAGTQVYLISYQRQKP